MVGLFAVLSVCVVDQSSLCDRSPAVVGARVWNKMPASLRLADNWAYAKGIYAINTFWTLRDAGTIAGVRTDMKFEL